MKLLRICLLVLLAVLLPVRGAMATAMLCAPAGMGQHGEMRVAGAEHAHQHAEPKAHEGAAHSHAGQDIGDGVEHDHGSSALHGHDSSSQDRCSLCSACCASPPLLSTPAGIVEPTALGAVSFPTFSAPAPTFLSDGQERPPRSI